MTFKVGDKVKRIDAGGGCNDIKVGDIVEISSVSCPDSNYGLCYFVGGGSLNPKRLELVRASEEEAVKFLTEKGYTVTPPPEPLKGKIVIYDSCIGVTSCSYEQWNKYNNKKDCRLIAIVDWTEGQGL